MKISKDHNSVVKSLTLLQSELFRKSLKKCNFGSADNSVANKQILVKH